MIRRELVIDRLMDPLDPAVQMLFGSNASETLSTMMHSLLAMTQDEKTSFELSWLIDGDAPFEGRIQSFSQDDTDFFEMTGLTLLPGSEQEVKEMPQWPYQYSIKLDHRLISYDGKEVLLPVIDSKESVNGWAFLDELGTLLKKLKTRSKITLRIRRFGLEEVRKLFFDEFSDVIVFLDEDNQYDFSASNESIGVDLSVFGEDETIEDFITEEKVGKSMSTMNRDNQREIDRYRERLLSESQFYCEILVSAENQTNAQLMSSIIPDWLFGQHPYLVEKDHQPRSMEDFAALKRPDDLMRLFPKSFLTHWFDLPVVQGETPKAFLSSSEMAVSGVGESAIDARNISSDKPISLPLDILSSHVFVTGATGQGKTKTIFNLLDRIYNQHGINFLIIEAAKKEYRGLKALPDNLLREIMVITPGAETLWPLRINLFEPMGFGTPDYASPLINHIYLLEKVFRAALPMPSILPMILLRSLKKVYEDRGWKVMEINRNPNLSIPTINDLLSVMDGLIQTSTYASETKDHIRAMFDTRFSRLSEDLMGQILFSERTSPSWEELFNRPVLIEMDGLHEDNINLIAIFMIMMLREYRNLKKHEESSGALKHLLILEEAHVILSDEEEGASQDEFNPKVEASKLIGNLLKEVRALGEGLIISDQAPATMPQSVLRNTRTKIIHQISDPVDKAIIKSSLGLTDAQLDQLGRLQKGNAFFTTEGYNYPVILRSIVSDEILSATPEDDQGLAKRIESDDYFVAEMKRTYEGIEGQIDRIAHRLQENLQGTLGERPVFKDETVELTNEILFELAGDADRLAVKELAKSIRLDHVSNYLDLAASLHYQTDSKHRMNCMKKIDEMRYNIENLEVLNG